MCKVWVATHKLLAVYRDLTRCMCRKDGSGALTSFPAIHEPHKQLPVQFPHMHSHTLYL